MALPALDLYVNRYRETAPDLHVGQKLDPGPLKSSALFRALHSWSSRPAMGGRLHVIGKSGQARAAAASAGADGGWNSDTGREFRHGQRHAQPRIPNCKRRCDACEEFPEASAIVPRHGLVRNFESVISVPPTHPTYPFHSSSCVVAWHRNGAAHWGRHPPHHHHPPYPPNAVALHEWCRLGPPPTPPPLFTVLGGA